MEIDPDEFIRKLREAKKKGVNLILIRTISSGLVDPCSEIKELHDIDMDKPIIQENGAIWFDDIGSNRIHEFFPQQTAEIRSIGKPII